MLPYKALFTSYGLEFVEEFDSLVKAIDWLTEEREIGRLYPISIIDTRTQLVVWRYRSPLSQDEFTDEEIYQLLYRSLPY